MEKIVAGDPETQTADIVADNLERMKGLFPEAFAEGKVDFDVLRQLFGDTVDKGDEKYGLNWHGKRRARQLALTPSIGTLRPSPEDSVDWDTTKNLMIEGDNLEVLKLLQKSYAGKVKLICIDPPYNTGKDFVYPDDYRDNIRNYLKLTGQIDDKNRKLSSHTEASGRFHTDWVNMMYPRLKLARNLLREDGALFIMIDDVERANLQILCNELFGEDNFLAGIAWQKTYSPANDKKGIDSMHDSILAYQKSEMFKVNLLPRTDKQDSAYKNPDNDPRGPWKAADSTRAEHRDYAYFPITTPSGKEVFPAKGRSWVFKKEELPKLLNENLLWFGKSGESKPSRKLFLSEVKKGLTPTTWWDHEAAGHNDEAKKELKALFDGGVLFQTPKPLRLVQRIVHLATRSERGDIVLDFFAGSGTTGHAIMEVNKNQKGNQLRFILVQFPESTTDARYRTIFDITKERLRRAAKQIKDENSSFSGDIGFRVFTLDTSNIRAWDQAPSDLEVALLSDIDHIEPGRTELDILYEILLKQGLDLCVPIESRFIVDKSVYSIGAGTLIACLDEAVSRDDAEPLAVGISDWHDELAPAGDSTVVFRDSAFADDVAKTNLAEILKQRGLGNVRSL